MYIVSLGLVLSACAPTHSTLPQSTCPPIAMSTEGWPRVDLGPFSLQVPPGFDRADVQPVDSRAGAFRRGSDSAEIAYDYGWYSNDLAPDPNVVTEDIRCIDNIGDLPATIVIGARNVTSEAGSEYVVAGTWRNVEHGDQPVHLTVWSTTPDSAEIALLRRVLYSVLFEHSK